MKKNISGIILAGGNSKRMGTDKSFLPINGTSFVNHLILQLFPFVDEIILVSNHSEHDQFAARRVLDSHVNFGPVAGVYSGLKASKSDFNIVISCDAPLVDFQVLEYLFKQRRQKYDLVQFSIHHQPTPLIAMYHKKSIFYFRKAFKNNTRRLILVTKKMQVKTIITPKKIQSKLVNINRPEDLKHIPS
ncbi:molybdenum cofactor guanylyltransferase [Ochrovirga pacifica]|uniref:molybdenum cofactor guanylyltransferase n=1 Tax=Ochrovirga pacifica TaxID=1042376 RepID=UPI0002559B23|nr:molybdenum cofactor guanylyltransferase [Ochrovirga pacifica]